MFFQLLEMGAADFLLPPLRRSELLPRLKRQARVTRRGDCAREKTQGGYRAQTDHRREPRSFWKKSGAYRDSRDATPLC